MGFDHFRHARRIDADTIGVYANDMTKLLQIDKATANYTTISGQNASGKSLLIKSSGTNDYPYIRWVDNSRIEYRSGGGSPHMFIVVGTEVFRVGTTGEINIKETTTPTALPDFGALYTKNDNELYFQTGAGVEKTVTTV